jgi:hypothetical protein
MVVKIIRRVLSVVLSKYLIWRCNYRARTMSKLFIYCDYSIISWFIALVAVAVALPSWVVRSLMRKLSVFDLCKRCVGINVLYVAYLAHAVAWLKFSVALQSEIISLDNDVNRILHPYSVNYRLIILLTHSVQASRLPMFMLISFSIRYEADYNLRPVVQRPIGLILG